MAEDEQEAQEQEEVRHVDPSSGAASQPGSAAKMSGDKPTAAYDDEADLTVAPAWEQPEPSEQPEDPEDQLPPGEPPSEPPPSEPPPDE